MKSRVHGAPLAKDASARSGDSTRGTDPRRARSILPRAEPGDPEGRLRRPRGGADQECGIGVLVSGEGSNLQALLDAGLPVVAVASSKAGVRALARAEAAGVAAADFSLQEYPDREARDAAMAAWFEERGVELVVCAGYMHLLEPSFLDRFPRRVLNVHPAPLPDFPGAHPLEDLLAAGAPQAAATVHYVDEGVDTGAVIATELVAVLPGDTVETLRSRVHEAEHRLLPEVVRTLCAR